MKKAKHLRDWRYSYPRGLCGIVPSVPVGSLVNRRAKVTCKNCKRVDERSK